ncbi:MAG: L-threonylcarbamoyladenylate synthase [Candidatus Nealsonbacteria bacterium]|nr:L-threonylcarbamoyladenylate synthase [Candidatus Nealsonbacteria bacterium]
MKILKTDQENFNQLVEKTVKAIRNGRVIVCPTDTVYGLIADATNKKAVEKIFKIKKRPKNKPVPIFIKDINVAKKLAKINEKQEAFLKSVWPGKITVVLNRKKSRLYGVDKKTIALRIPKYGLLLSLAKQLNCPLTGTSANISGRLVSTRIKEVIKQFQNQKQKLDLVIDAGNLKPAKPSKVIDLTGSKPKILRK